jgi:hypothetical protein
MSVPAALFLYFSYLYMPKAKSHNDSKKQIANIQKTKENVAKVDILKNVEEGE